LFHEYKTIFSLADFECMKFLTLLLLVSSLFAEHIYEKKVSKENERAMRNEKIKCRLVCDKKVYKEQKIADAVSFYKNNKNYTFSKENY